MDFRGMTVDRLRELLEGVDGDLPVFIQTDYNYEQPGWDDAEVYEDFEGEGRHAFTINA